MRSLLTIPFLLSAMAAAQAPTIATVSDPVSPGTVGDQLLSLDEAIQLANGTLPIASLSAAEQAQLTGTGTPTVVEIDAATTPTITLQATPSPIDRPAAGGIFEVRGVGGRPVLDATATALGLRVRTNGAALSNLELRGGQVGIDADSSAGMVMNTRLLLSGLHVTGQSQTGIKLSAVGMMRMLMVTLTHTSFEGLHTALDVDDRSMNGPVMADLEFVTFENVARGLFASVNATGAMTMLRLWRCKMTQSERLAVVRHDPTSDQRIMLMLVASAFETTDDTVDATGSSLVETAVHVHASDILPAPGKNAFVLGPSTARIDFHASENTIRGDLDIEEGPLNRRLWAWNNQFVHGTMSVRNLGAPNSFRWNRFENCTIRNDAASTAAFQHTSSEFVGCTFDGQAFAAPIALENCLLENCTLTGNVTQVSPAPSAWLGDAWASTDTPSIGSTLALHLDLPAGMMGIWQIGVSNSRVILTQEPWRDYAFVRPNILVPGIYAYRSTVSIPVPNDAGLIGQELYCWPTTAPFLGQSHVPPINLPRGVHLTIR
ncbi:MAG: hypothetical protein ACO3RU_08955 [Planctomycetota bacterium]|jgi:hypothetical protein